MGFELTTISSKFLKTKSNSVTIALSVSTEGENLRAATTSYAPSVNYTTKEILIARFFKTGVLASRIIWPHINHHGDARKHTAPQWLFRSWNKYQHQIKILSEKTEREAICTKKPNQKEESCRGVSKRSRHIRVLCVPSHHMLPSKELVWGQLHYSQWRR